MNERLSQLMGQLIGTMRTSKEDIKVEFTLKAEEWAVQRYSSKQTISDLQRELNYRVESAIIAACCTDINETIVKKIAEQLVQEYDFKAAVQKSMHDKIQSYLQRI